MAEVYQFQPGNVILVCPDCRKQSGSQLGNWYTAYTTEYWHEKCLHCGQVWNLELKVTRGKDWKES
jgi:hypothetical protein